MEKITGLANETENRFANFVKHIYCILAFVIGWVIFRADSMSYAWEYLQNMFGVLHLRPDEFIYALPYYADRYELIMFVAAVLCSIPIFTKFKAQNNAVKILYNIWLLFLFILSSATIAASTYNPFIYFRF